MANSVVTFFEKVGGWLKKLFTNTTIEHKILATVTYVAPLVEGILGFVDPAISAVVTRVITMVEADLATVTATVDGAKVTPGTPAAATVTSALTSVKTNLTGLLADAGVKNSANFAKIQAAVNTVIGEAVAMLGELAPGSVATS